MTTSNETAFGVFEGKVLRLIYDALRVRAANTTDEDFGDMDSYYLGYQETTVMIG